MATLAFLPGCGGSDAADNESEPLTAVPSGRATVDEFIAHFNKMLTKEKIDYNSYLDLMYPEDEEQKVAFAAIRAIELVAELDHVFVSHFGERIDPKRPIDLPELAGSKPAYITERQEERAKGVYLDRFDNEQLLYLVKIGKKWWISGYTIVYDPYSQDLIDHTGGDEALIQLILRRVPPLINRIANRQYATAQLARRAIRERFWDEMTGQRKVTAPGSGH